MKKTCLHHQFSTIAGQCPEQTAVVQGEKTVSFRRLDRESDRLATALRTNDEASGASVAIYMPPGIEFMIAALGILKTGSAYVPLDINDPAERTRTMIHRIRPKRVITLPELVDRLSPELEIPVKIQTGFQGNDPTDSLKSDTGTGHTKKAESALESPCDPSFAAYIIHTSGSTGTPKGIPIPHRALMNLLAEFDRLQPIGPEDRCSLWSALNFDVSVYEIWSALMSGATLFIPDDMVRFDAKAFIKWLSVHQITSAYFPPFMISDLARTSVFPKSIKRLLTGVSAIPAQLLYDIKKRHPDLCLINGYGPAEATVCATLYPVPDRKPQTAVAPIGKPVPNLDVFVLDPDGQPVNPGEKGEICIAGIQVANGYVNDPERSAKSFVPNPFADYPLKSPKAGMYKTGDLGTWLPDGNLMFSGRVDFQIKYKGIRIEPGEIEQTITAFPGINQAAVVLKKSLAGQERLTAYINADVDKTRLMEFLAEKLPRTLLPESVISLPTLPQTSQGKIDRAGLTARNDFELASLFPADDSPPVLTDLQKQVRQVWKQVLGLETLSVTDHFLLSGGDSISGVKIISRINQAFGTALTLDVLFSHPVLEDFAYMVSQVLPDGQIPDVSQAGVTDSSEPSPAPNRTVTPIPLLPDQHLIWMFEKLHPGTSVYHIPLAYIVRGAVDPVILEQAVRGAAGRHPALATVVHLKTDHPCQAPEQTEPKFFYQALSQPLPESSETDPDPDIVSALQKQITRPFDLETGPLFRTVVFTDPDGRTLICFVFHHMIFDGWSAGLFIQEINRWYALLASRPSTRTAMPEPARTGIDFFEYAARRLRTQEQQWDAARPFFDDYLKNLPQPILTDPTGFAAAFCPVAIDADCLMDIRSLAAAHHTTPFAVLLLCFQLTLYRFNGIPDQVTGIAHAARDDMDTETLSVFS